MNNRLDSAGSGAATKARRPFRRSPAGRITEVSGRVVIVVGAMTILVGAALTWARFTVLGVEFSIPGVAGWGAVTAGLAVLALMQTRNLPLLTLILGLMTLIIGWQANEETGKAVRMRMLGIQQSLAPVNDKLMRVGLPPIEPFTMTGPRRNHVGPGPVWTFWGGAALMLGATVQFAGARLRRTCPRCHTLWATDRADSLTFCPSCGERVGPPTVCQTCAAPLCPGDRFCSGCGAPTAL